MIIRRDLANGGAVANDSSFAKITLTAAVAGQLCGVTNAAGTSCVEPLPAGARPNATPMAVLKKDSTGFTLNLHLVPPPRRRLPRRPHLPDRAGLHHRHRHHPEVRHQARQRARHQRGVRGGKLMFVKQTGVTDLTSMLPSTVSFTPGSSGGIPGAAEKFRKLGWMEYP